MKNIILIIALGAVVLNFNDKSKLPNKNIEKVTIKEKNQIIEDDYIKRDEKIVTYIENMDIELETLDTNDESIKEKAKDMYTTLTDFIFNNGVINDITFDSLTSASKEKILSIYKNIDTKIENKFPNYKETIKNRSKETYNNTKEKIGELGQNIKEKYQNYINDSKNKEVVDSFNNDKNNVVETYDKIKDKINSKRNKRGD